jgi:hypothetical protein
MLSSIFIAFWICFKPSSSLYTLYICFIYDRKGWIDVLTKSTLASVLITCHVPCLSVPFNTFLVHRP